MCFATYGQTYSISGRVTRQQGDSSVAAAVAVLQKNVVKLSGGTGRDGAFSIAGARAGKYRVTITAPGFAAYHRDITITDGDVPLGTISLQPIIQTLDEVKIVAQALAMVQKDDTIEYNASAYKVNPDADAADLVRKMPSIEVNGKEIKAQGEQVLKVLVDGKPFFGEDAWTTLKSLPADVVQKVQVYNEKGDQERLTGFSEGPQSKTINIVTKPDRRKGLFGNVYAGGGADNSREGIYGTGLALHRFGGERRISLTGQANNVNAQSFTEQGATQGGGGGSGITTTHAAGINYTDKWGEKTNISGSYFYNNTANTVDRETRRVYVLPSATGQVYNEESPAENNNAGHRGNLRLSYAPDSMNTIVLQPSFTLSNGDGLTSRVGTTATGTQPLNRTTNNNDSRRATLAAGNNAVYTRRFAKKGRTFSASANTGYNSGNTETRQYARNEFFTDTLLNTTLDQRVLQQQASWNIAGNATYTEPVAKRGLLKAQYNIGYAPSVSERNAYNYDFASDGYSLPDSQLSNGFRSGNTTHKAGGSYLHRRVKDEFSVGLNYQVAVLNNEQQSPVRFAINRSFSNVLPVATYQYRFSKSKNIQCNYTTNTHAPSITQLQNVVNNTDPLHLSTGNPALKQPYTHNLSLRYSASGAKGQRNMSASVTGVVTRHYIASSSLIAVTDTNIGQVLLPAGAQLTMPVNVDGNASLNGNVTYSMPVKAIKCRVNLNANAGLSRMPSIINNVVNYQQNRHGGAGLSLNSNISERVDFTFSSNTTVTANDNPVNRQLNSTFVNEALRASLNLVLWKGIIINSAVSYQANFGLSAGYNRNFVLWNMAIGKKLFKKQQGDLRLSVFDALNENNNIQRTITETYIQDMRTNILQRYYMLVFTYKISRFGS